MPKYIIWSDNAKEDISNLVDYLLANWGEKITEEYVNNINKLVHQFADFPKLYPVIHTKMKIRK